MKTIIIDGREMKTREDAHIYLAKVLSLPDYYGRNLDALHDCLTDINETTNIIVYYCGELLLSLGAYGSSLMKVLEFSAKENVLLTVFFYIIDEPCKSKWKTE